MHIGPPIQKVVNKHPRMPTSHPLASFAKPFKSFPLAASRQQNPVSGTGTMSITKDRKSRKIPNCFQDTLSRPEKSTPEPQNCPNLLHTPSRLISACKNPRTPSLSYDRNGPSCSNRAATLTDPDRFQIRNTSAAVLNFDSSRSSDTELSERVFVSAGSSKSSVKAALRLSHDGGAIATSVYTMDPYVQFRRIMQEMMDAHHVGGCQPLD